MVEDGGGDLTTADVVEEVVVEEVVVAEVAVAKGGKASPFLSGKDRTGLGAVPTIFPCSGKVMVEAVEVAAAETALAAQNLAALS